MLIPMVISADDIEDLCDQARKSLGCNPQEEDEEKAAWINNMRNKLLQMHSLWQAVTLIIKNAMEEK